MSRALDLKAAERLIQLCNMFSSDFDGERAAAAKLADEHVKRLGLGWADVIISAGEEAMPWIAMARHCQDNADLFTPRERAFVANMARGRYPPSNKQLAWLEVLYARLRSRAAA